MDRRREAYLLYLFTVIGLVRFHRIRNATPRRAGTAPFSAFTLAGFPCRCGMSLSAWAAITAFDPTKDRCPAMVTFAEKSAPTLSFIATSSIVPKDSIGRGRIPGCLGAVVRCLRPALGRNRPSDGTGNQACLVVLHQQRKATAVPLQPIAAWKGAKK
jgi:hypothetical protein